MNLSAWAIRYRPIVLTLVVMLMAWGLISYFTMPRREDPEFTIRVCVVATSWPGTPAEEMEKLVTYPLEDVINGIEEVDEIRSTTINGQSTIFVELSDLISPKDIPNVWDKVRARVELVKMPDPAVRPVVNDEFGDTTVFLVAVHQEPSHDRQEIREQDRYTARELDIYADVVKDSLQLLPGVARVDRYGVREEAIFLQTDLASWSQLGVTTSTLQQLVADRNIVEAGGDINTSVGRYSVKPGGELNAVEELRSIIAAKVTSGDNENQVYLTDLGLEVVRDYEDPPQYYCRYGDPRGSTPCVMVGVTMKSGSNIVNICDAANARIKQLVEVDQALPADISVSIVSDQSDNVNAKIKDVVVNVIEAILIVLLVVYIVVGFRTSAVMAANIPVVVLASVGVITIFGVQLEQISLASIVIALGLLVDNAVQVCDQARTNQMQGMAPIPAAVSGANTLAVPMLIGTLTTVAAFLPMLFALEGGSKEYVYSLPVTLSVTLGLSWLLAMTLCVVLAAAFIRPPADASRPSSPVLQAMQWFGRSRKKKRPASPRPPGQENLAYQIYGQLGSVAVAGKWITLVVSVVLLFGAISLPVSTEFFPMDRRDQFAIRVWLPETATIEQTNAKAKEVEEIIRGLSPAVGPDGAKIERLRAMRTIVGGGGSRWYLSWEPEPPSPNFAEILIRTTDGRLTPEFVADIRRAAERGNESLAIEPVTGARVVPIELMLGPPADPLTIRITGPGYADIDTLRGVMSQVKAITREQPETWDVNDSMGVAGYQLFVDLNSDRASLAGVTNQQMAHSLKSYFSGLSLTTFREGDHLVPVYFRVEPDQRRTIDGLKTAYVEGYQAKIPLSSIAEIVPRWEPAKIERRDLNRVVEVSSQIETGASGNDVAIRVLNSEAMEVIRRDLPLGYTIEAGGALEESADAQTQMLTSFGISLGLIVLCLVIQYNGLAKPLVILATLPLALIGALPGLYFSDNPMGFMPQLGVLSLFGIVLNTGIIFIEFADSVIAEKSRSSNGEGPIQGLTVKEFRQCMVDAGKQRLLPIFLTTATTVGGLLPLALAGGPLWEGMAWCMISGLLVATLLTLLVVPALYAILVEHFGVQPNPAIVRTE